MANSWTFTSTADDNLTCVICREPFRNPRKLAECGHYFCQVCIVSWVRAREDPTCVVCRAPITSQNAITGPDRLIVNMLDELLIKCDMCGYSGKKGSHCCPLYTCDKYPCTFLGSDEDEVRRHQLNCRYGGGGGSSSSSAAKEDSQRTRYADREEEQPWYAQPDNLIVAGTVVAASLVAGLVLGRSIGKRENNSK
ncbi:hypothetical protein BCR33DRAFT_716797 [Rhizoclosmatium globosum]|uniref:RING-type domain-containing protein n=1 Tax=Rhizoclosmatium globosum TaxID=329046 RepID=A0A1Y2CCT9_9FUNG|nr:hypothetical protein BCR33DRAFT_716797 [Rhizoclosmatium globosum]|eukprot:ORY44858.1 hypothetical protein BCR33DRAFT_716797 [Rhizoclosmatium globosum]